MRDRKLDDLAPNFKGLAMELLARLTEAGIAVMVVETLRTEAQHQEDLANGRSWIAHSKHQDGLAIDIAPYELYNESGPDKLDWDSGHGVWEQIGQTGKALGLTWGGDWTHKDMGHFEL